MVAERRCDTPWLRSRERISERIDEQVVDQSLLEAARADVAEAENNLATQVASDHEDPVELKTLADANRALVELRDRRIHGFKRVHPLIGKAESEPCRVLWNRFLMILYLRWSSSW